MALSEKKRKSNDRWIKENYSQVKLSMPNEEADALDTFCKANGYTKAGFIRQAIKEKMEHENAQQQQCLNPPTETNIQG